MRNDIKRFFVAVLAACGLAVSAALAAPSHQAELGVTQKNYYVDEKGGNVSPYAAAATAAPDITDRLQNLGIPLIGRYPDGRITQSTYARNVWDMKYHDGKVFIGSGNSANTGPSPNAGPAEVWEIDPATGAAQLSYKIGGEQADLFRVFGDGCLYVPDHDPPGTGSYNCYYKRDTSGNWSNGGWLTGEDRVGEVHVYDMAEFDGKMFACGYYLWYSDDGGATWKKKGIHAGRNYAFLPYGDQLMTSTSYYDWNSSDVFRYWNKTTKAWDVPDRPISAAMAFPDQSNLPGNYLKLVRPAQFGNKCLYIGAYEFNDHQNDPFGAYVSTFDGTKFSATAIPAATGQVPWDILVKDGTAYLLVQDRTLLANTDRKYVNRVFASTDAASWTELFSFRATTFAMSLEKVGDTFYFGMGTKDRVCDECGTIYRVNPTAGPVIVNFPTLTQSVSEGAGKTTVIVQLSTAAAEDVTVPLVLSGTAVAGSDFLSFPTTVVIPAGSTTATFDIALVDDALFEVAETLILTMGAPTHAIAGSASKLTITITDNDGANKPAVRFASESQNAVAGSTASLVASLTKVSGAATTFGLLFEGTATNNLDYTVDKTSVTIPAGETEATVSFSLLERAAGKTVIASIKYWPSNADMGAPRIHTMTVAASEAPPPALPTAAFASAAQTVQENTGTVSISVVLSQASSSAVSIPFTLGGTALAGADYQIPASPLTIPAGQTSGTIDIVLAADGLAEPAETIIVVLGTPTGATLGATTTHTLTIAASEAASALAAPSYQARLTVQGYAGAELADFPVLVRLSPQTVNGFHYGTCKADGSDVVFVDENGEPLNYQLDTWNPSGESLFWVRLPTLRPGVAFHVRWGDSQSNVGGARSAATWNANYGAVWHMGEASGVCANSTGHGSKYDATPGGETSESVRYDGNDAPVGGARTTSKGKNAYLVVPNYDELKCGDTFTFSGWMRLTGSCRWGNPLSRKMTPDTATGWEMMMVGTSLSQVNAFGQGKKITVTFEEPGFDKTWVHFALVYSNSTVSVYGNGALLKSGAVTAVNDNGLPLYIGNDGMASFHYVKGAFDELRLMKGAASADWVKAEHATVAQADFLAYGASGPAWTASSLCISGVGVVASGDSFVDLSAMLHGLGENATEASIQLAYGFDETSLVKTQTVGTATATGPMTFRLDRLLPQRVYCVRVVAVNNLGERAVSDPVHVMTAVSQDASGNAGDLLAIRVDEVVENGALEKLTLTFPPAEEERDLYAAWGGQHGGATTNGWTHVQKLTTVTSGCGTYEYPLPSDWGAEDNRVIRFFLDGTPRSCSSSVYWRDCSEPLITGLSLDGRGGDTLKVTGSLASFAGSSCTLKVLVGRTPEALNQEWTGLPGSGLQELGSFALTLFSADTESPKYLKPGETYYVCVEATAGDSVSRSQVMQVTMAEEDAIGSATASVTRRTVTFSGVLAGRGMGESAKVSLWVGEENDEGTLEQAGEELDVQGGAFSFTHKFNDFERTYYWQLRAVSTSAGETAVVTTRTAVASCTTADTATYTWNGSADDDWENPANWGNSGGDAFGYPNGTQTTVQFPAGTKAQIVLRKAMSVGTLNLDKQDCEVTFARAAGQEAVELEVKKGLLIKGMSLRLVLDGVALRSPGLRFSASEGDVRLSNGASWYLSGRLENMDGGELWLGPGTSLSCSDYWFSGGLTVIDDATLTVRGSVLLGKSVTGGTIRFVGKQPAFRCSAQGAQVYSELETANVRLEFALPAGGYATPPFVNASANPNYILGYNGNNKRLYPIMVDIARGSPAKFAQQTTETTLISWGKGICPEIIQTAAKPGANATFVWSEQTVGKDAYPVSLGVRLSPTGLKILIR